MSSFACNLLFFCLFALILHIFNNLTYVKFTFALFQGQIAACNTCIKFEVRFFKLHLQARVTYTARFTEVSSSVPSSAYDLLFSFACCCFLRFCCEIPFGSKTNVSNCNLYSFTFRHSSYQQGYEL